MNLPQFLKKIDADVAGMPRETLEAFVHELARTLPEEKRSDFLELMKTVEAGGGSASTSTENCLDDLTSEVEEIIAILDSINMGDRCLDSEYNEEWDDWYNSDVDEILFSDPEELLPDIEKGVELLHRCIDEEQYGLGYGLAELLSALEVSATGDYDDFDGSPLVLDDLYDQGLLNGSFLEIVRESVFLAYMGNELSDRAEEMFCMMESYQCYKVKLEDIMQMGPHDLPEFGEFLPLWIEYLGNRTGGEAKNLLREAQGMIENTDQILETARKFVDKHPELYKQILENGSASGENDRMLRIGMEALEKIPASCVIRSEIALLTAGYACRMGKGAASEHCWLETFRSDTSVVNYMRIRFMSKDWNQYREQIVQIYRERYGYTVNQKENELHRNAYFALLFFEGDFDGAMKHGMNEKKPLGWSFTFMKEGLALFLLLLFEGDTLPKGLASMLGRAVSGCDFRAEAYRKGTDMAADQNDRELFWELFRQWKAEVVVPQEKAAQWLEKIEQLVSVRTEGIMNANRRKYYGECASFIAALGEVKESQGIGNARKDIMNSYKAKYSRRRAFHQELRNYGMM